MKKLQGGCVCGKVQYAVNDDFKTFYQCHCKQCQQLTGSAFAANIFADIDNIDWLEGERFIQRYDHPEREFSKAFCKECGSALPFLNQSKTSLLIPAGSLLDDPGIRPRANIFSAEKVCWFDEGSTATSFEGFPKRS